MPSSMTGFGRASSRGRGPRLLCEVRSVNHRFLTTKIRMPAALQQLESLVEQRVQSRFHRGSVEVQVFWRDAGERLASHLDVRVADHYLAQIRAYLRKRGIAEEASPQVLFSMPGVLAPADPDAIAADYKPELLRVLEAALDALATMRGREGERLTKALRREVQKVSACAAKVRLRVPATVAAYQKRLADRLKVLLHGQSIAPDPQMLAREVAVFADRSDVTEELDRLTSHEAEFEKLLAKSGPVGRELEFLVQEMGREVQTIGSKLQDAALLALAREAKASVERLREQVANLE
jgi:uncharacterized protein (TIGR00255 family)